MGGCRTLGIDAYRSDGRLFDSGLPQSTKRTTDALDPHFFFFEIVLTRFDSKSKSRF